MLFLGGKIIASLVIVYGDFKERKILVFVLIALFIVNLAESYFILDFSEWLLITGINALVVSFIFSVTYIYFKIIKKIKNPAQSHLGIGDWLFFLALTPLYLPEVFIYVFLVMNIVSLIYGIVVTLIMKKHREIPYAGISALIFVLITVIQYLSPIEYLTLH